MEVQRQIHTCDHDDNEAVEADLTQHERPVVRERSSRICPDSTVYTQAPIGPFCNLFTLAFLPHFFFLTPVTHASTTIRKSPKRKCVRFRRFHIFCGRAGSYWWRIRDGLGI